MDIEKEMHTNVNGQPEMSFRLDSGELYRVSGNMSRGQFLELAELKNRCGDITVRNVITPRLNLLEGEL